MELKGLEFELPVLDSELRRRGIDIVVTYLNRRSLGEITETQVAREWEYY
jgi:hypothetical protein